ncbi:MAG: WYL domain-containing protein [Bacteroidales bacterium]|nr:WYL domain-containing protein [Bacteroidales bacterium]
MPTNKNALIRYKVLDGLLSDRHHLFDIHDLTDYCNKALYEYGLSEVTQRCVEKDINFLESRPFCADIERYRTGSRCCIRYSDPSFSIFKKQLSDEEENLLQEVLNTIGQFDGLANFEWLDGVKKSLNLKERPKVISFSNNPYLLNSNLLGVLFDTTSNQTVIELEYHTYSNISKRHVTIHPYLLKQYNNRWYIIGGAHGDGKILNFALDRIDKVTPLPEIKFEPCIINLVERFEDIIGVTLYDDRQIEHIVFWASDSSKDYILTKPIIGSQHHIKNDNSLRDSYPLLSGGTFFSIDCIPNYELIRELCSFGKELVVLEPKSITEQIYNRILAMMEEYNKLRT